MPTTSLKVMAAHLLKTADMSDRAIQRMEALAGTNPTVEQLRILHDAQRLKDANAKTRKYARELLGLR
jgi:hypothetical protein